MEKDLIKTYRLFLKDSIRKVVDFSRTDQNRGLPPPPVEKPFAPEARRIDLPGRPSFAGIGPLDLKLAIERRESRRTYSPAPLSLEALSFLLWATQGVKAQLDRGHALRTVPSAGCRHAFETYLCILNVQAVDPGIYRYLPLEHQLLFEFAEEDLDRKIRSAALGQPYPAEAAVTFVWTALPYRMEWRYGLAAHRSSPSMWATSARTSIWPARPSGPASVPWQPTIRGPWTAFCASTAMRNLPCIWPL
jgi:hypothetical protein